MKRNMAPEKRYSQAAKVFVCACATCGGRQEIFASELHQTNYCKACGGILDFEKCSFDSPRDHRPSHTTTPQGGKYA